MATSTLALIVSGRLDGRLRRLEFESRMSRTDLLRGLLSSERIDRLEAVGPRLLMWGWGHGPWRRTVRLQVTIEAGIHERLRLVAAANGASVSDVARYLITGVRTVEELDAEARSLDPIEP